MKILMTDDDSDDRLLALFAFKKLNAAHSIDFVVDGQELIDYLIARVDAKSELPDLILLDLNMPRKDGRVALKEIKESLVVTLDQYTQYLNGMVTKSLAENGHALTQSLGPWPAPNTSVSASGFVPSTWCFTRTPTARSCRL